MKLEILGMKINEEYIEPRISAMVQINGILEYQAIYRAIGFLEINGKIILQMNGKTIKLPYNLISVRQVIKFLELEERQLTPPKKGRHMEVPVEMIG